MEASSRTTHSFKLLQCGFSLAEAIVAIFIMGIVASTLVGAVIYGMQIAAITGARARASNIADEGMEIVRGIRDENFSNLVDGSYGLQTAANKWMFSGTNDVTDIFTRQITIAPVDSVTKKITSTVTWKQNSRLNGTTTEISYLGNIGLLNQQSNSLAIDTSSAAIGGAANKELQSITVQNSGSSNIVIDKITVSWTNSARSIQGITMGGIVVWSKSGPGTPAGNQLSGTQLDIQNVTLTTGAAATIINRFLFTGNMVGNLFTITFTMADGSAKTISYP